MDAYYHFEVDPARNIVRLKLAGFFNETNLQAFLAARATAFAKLKGPPNSHVTLVDVRDMKIQSQDMVASFRHLLTDERYFARRFAFVVGSTLARMQLLRALDERRARTFATTEEAEAWLFAKEEAAA